MSWPSSLTPRADLLEPVNNWAAFLIGDISPIQPTIAITTRTVGLSTLPNKGVISIDDEAIFYDGINVGGPTPVLLNCQRGFDNTIAASHAAGTRVEVRWIAAHHNRLAQLIYDLQASFGLGMLSSENQWGPMAPPYSSLANLLQLNLPQIIPQTGANWSATHMRRRPVAVQLWSVDPSNANAFHLFEANIAQEIDPSGLTPSTVTVEPFEASRDGVMILL